MKNLPYARNIEDRARDKTLPNHGRVIVLTDKTAWQAKKAWRLDPAAGRPFVILPHNEDPSHFNWSFARHFDMACVATENINDSNRFTLIAGLLLMNQSIRGVMVSCYDTRIQPKIYWPQRCDV